MPILRNLGRGYRNREVELWKLVLLWGIRFWRTQQTQDWSIFLICSQKMYEGSIVSNTVPAEFTEEADMVLAPGGLESHGQGRN
jgi:hypothetical protein